MKQERNWLVGLAVAMAAMIGVVTAANAAIPGQEGYSYTSPAAELVVPYDVQDDRVSFIVVSNVSDRDVSTHWIFWNESCAEEVDFSICLTKNDTVVVDPRNMQAVNANNEAVGPKIMLDGTRGVATIIAYEPEDNCAGYPASNKIADEALVGAFTFADTSVGYSFGNDALGLGTDYGSDPSVQVPEPAEGNSWEYAIQVFNPENVENSLVMLTHLAETSSGIVAPGTPAVKFATSVVDTYEVPTSLPDTSVSCSSYYSVTGGSNPIIPDETAVDSSGVILLQPVGTYPVAGTTFVYGIVGQAVLDFGASASVKVNEVGSAPPPPPDTWECEGDICALVQDGSGEFSSEEDCEAACSTCEEEGEPCGLEGSPPCCEGLVCGDDDLCEVPVELCREVGETCGGDDGDCCEDGECENDGGTDVCVAVSCAGAGDDCSEMDCCEPNECIVDGADATCSGA